VCAQTGSSQPACAPANLPAVTPNAIAAPRQQGKGSAQRSFLARRFFSGFGQVRPNISSVLFFDFTAFFFEEIHHLSPVFAQFIGFFHFHFFSIFHLDPSSRSIL
jgi:hypothetical protein